MKRPIRFNSQPLNQPHVLDRINFIKKMIQTHQSHLMDNIESEERKFNDHESSFQQRRQSLKVPSKTNTNKQSRSLSKQNVLGQMMKENHSSLMNQVPKRSENCRTYSSDFSNTSFHDTKNTEVSKKIKAQPQNRCQRSKTSVNGSDGDPFDDDDHHNESTYRLRKEELKAIRDILAIRTQETHDQTQIAQQCQTRNEKLEAQVKSLSIELQAVRAERDAYRIDFLHWQDKADRMAKDENLISQLDMKKDLSDAQQSVVALRAYEAELQQKEKSIQSDWQVLEKQRSMVNDKQNALLNSQKLLSEQVESIQALKVRIERQEKKFQEKHKQQIMKIDECQRYLDEQEVRIKQRENEIQVKLEQQQQVEQKLMSMQMNEDLWNKRLISEMQTIESMKTKLLRTQQKS